MPKLVTESIIIDQIVKLRKTGHSLPEIRKITGKGNSTVFKYIKNVNVLPRYQAILESKQGGSIERSKNSWKEATVKAKSILNRINDRDKLLILACLYWGEGNKTEFNLNNSDPILIKVFIECLKYIGVKKEDLRITLRVYDDLDRAEAINFWSKILEIPKDKILGVNILKGKKKGKLRYGMCRIRVTKGGPHFKLIMSMIDLIKSDFNAAVVQWIGRGFPKPQM